MSTRVDGPTSPVIKSRDELVTYLEAGCKPQSDWRIGTEHEKFGFYRNSYAPVPYDGERGIRALLEALQYRFGWDAVTENGNIIALRRKDCPKGGSVSLEPGGQLELSGAPLENVHETYEELRHHLVEAGRDLDAPAASARVRGARRRPLRREGSRDESARHRMARRRVSRDRDRARAIRKAAAAAAGSGAPSARRRWASHPPSSPSRTRRPWLPPSSRSRPPTRRQGFRGTTRSPAKLTTARRSCKLGGLP